MKAYQMKIELLYSNPLIWRRFIMPADATFKRLHDIIQNSLNFKSGYPFDPQHLFHFDLMNDNLIVTNNLELYDENKSIKKQFKKHQLNEENDPHGLIAEQLELSVRQPQTLKIDKYIEKYGTIRYVYDYGDDWQIDITLEKIIEDYHYGYPTLIDGAETAPPEDVGGIPGYEEFLQVYHDEKHPDHQAIRAWAKEQRYREYDPEWTNSMLKFIKYKKTEWDKLK